MSAQLDNDLVGIATLMRRHIEIRNRSWMKRIHRDCFQGSDAVDFLVAQVRFSLFFLFPYKRNYIFTNY